MEKMGLAGKAKGMGAVKAPEHNQQQNLGDEENTDVQIAEAVGMKIMNTPEGRQTLEGAVGEGGDPVAKLGMFFYQLIDNLQNKFDQTDMPLSPRIWLSNNGVVDSWMEDLAEEGLVPLELVGPVKNEVLELLKLQEQTVGNKGAGGPPPQEGPMPQMMGAPEGMAPPMPQGQPMGGMV